MRDLLGQYPERGIFSGEFIRFSHAKSMPDKVTMLLRNIQDGDGNFLCDHMWFPATAKAIELNPATNSIISFWANVVSYRKSIRGNTVIDLKLGGLGSIHIYNPRKS